MLNQGKGVFTMKHANDNSRRNRVVTMGNMGRVRRDDRRQAIAAKAAYLNDALRGA